MSDYYFSQISHSDKTAIQGVTALLQAEEIRLDTNLDYTCGMYDDEMNIIATGSCFGNTLRCLAVGSRPSGRRTYEPDHLTSDLKYNLTAEYTPVPLYEMFFGQILRRSRIL